MIKLLYIHDGSFQATTNAITIKKEFDVVDINYHSYDQIDTIDFTHIIQHLDPSLWARYGAMHHIGWTDNFYEDFFDIENSCIVDEIWSSVAGNVCRYIPNVIDSSIYEKNYKFQEISEINGTFSFIVSSIGNKGAPIENVLRAFWEEFDPTEPVSLILNSGPETDKVVEFIKSRMNLYDRVCYQKIILIDNKLNVEQELAIMQKVDSYINTTRNWDNCAFHHMGFKKSRGMLINIGEDTLVSDIRKKMRAVYGIEDYEYNPNILDSYKEERFLERLKEVIND